MTVNGRILLKIPVVANLLSGEMILDDSLNPLGAAHVATPSQNAAQLYRFCTGIRPMKTSASLCSVSSGSLCAGASPPAPLTSAKPA